MDVKDFQIRYITMTDGGTGHQHIAYLGGQNQTKWKISRAGIVQRIKAGRERFYAVDPRTNTSAWLKVVEPLQGEPYVQTYADKDLLDNLLYLPRPCPPDCKDLS
jgi:hypothetical protein